MESPAQRYAAAIIIPEPIASNLAKLQHKHGLVAWQPAIPLHITLVSPFTTHEPTDSLATRWAPIAAATRPFTITLNGIGRFDNDESVLFAGVAPSAQLATLAESAMTAVGALRRTRSRPFVPHVTLAATAPRETIDDYIKRLDDEIIHEDFTCARFALLCLDETAREWRILREFPFSD